MTAKAELHGVVAELSDYLVDIKTLLPHPRNPRNGDLDILTESLMLHGQYSPIIVQKSTRFIVAGNSTYAACMGLDWSHVAAVVVDMDDEAALRYLLADNRANQQGGNDPDALFALLREMEGDFGGTGYTPLDYNELGRILDSNLGAALEPLGDYSDYQPVSLAGDLRSLTLSYPAPVFDALVHILMRLRKDEGESFTSVVGRLVRDELAAL